MVDLSPENLRVLMTPSGRVDNRNSMGWGAPRPPGPTQELIPVGRPPGAPTPGGPTPRAAPSPAAQQSLPIAMLALDAPLIQQPTAEMQVPWNYLMINLWRLAQPTGVTPGTSNGITVNAHGQVINTQTSGAQIENPTLNDARLTGTTDVQGPMTVVGPVAVTGAITAPTPPLPDNSTNVATTAWVQGQVYATQAFVTSQGYATQTFVLTQGFLHDAPVDGNRYARQNGAWVIF